MHFLQLDPFFNNEFLSYRILSSARKKRIFIGTKLLPCAPKDTKKELIKQFPSSQLKNSLFHTGLELFPDFNVSSGIGGIK